MYRYVILLSPVPWLPVSGHSMTDPWSLVPLGSGVEIRWNKKKCKWQGTDETREALALGYCSTGSNKAIPEYYAVGDIVAKSEDEYIFQCYDKRNKKTQLVHCTDDNSTRSVGDTKDSIWMEHTPPSSAIQRLRVFLAVRPLERQEVYVSCQGTDVRLNVHSVSSTYLVWAGAMNKESEWSMIPLCKLLVASFCILLQDCLTGGPGSVVLDRKLDRIESALVNVMNVDSGHSNWLVIVDIAVTFNWAVVGMSVILLKSNMYGYEL